MWNCLDCDETHSDLHTLCWRCGNVRDETPPASGRSREKTETATPHQAVPHFNGRTLFVLTAILGFFYLPWRAAGGSLGSFLILLVIGNAASALVGLVATALLPKANDEGDYCS